MVKSNDRSSKYAAELKVLLVLVLAVLVLWPGSPVFLVLFAAMLVALLVDGLAASLRRKVGLPEAAARALVLVSLLAGLIIFAFAAGPRLNDQLIELTNRLPQAVDRLEKVATQQPWGEIPKELEAENLKPRGSQIVEGITGVFSTAFSIIANIFVVFFIGLYLAFSPEVYVRGGLHLVPKGRRRRAEEIIQAVGHALRWWLLGRFGSMVAVAILTTIGLMIIQLPLALVLGVIAGLFSFVPYLGPIGAAVPALLIGLLESPLMAIYVLLVYSFVQFVEGNLITPLIQQRTVSLPPAALLSAQFALGYFYGLFGVLLATPLAVVTIVLVQMIYVQDTLGDRVAVLGSHSGRM